MIGHIHKGVKRIDLAIGFGKVNIRMIIIMRGIGKYNTAIIVKKIVAGQPTRGVSKSYGSITINKSVIIDMHIGGQRLSRPIGNHAIGIAKIILKNIAMDVNAIASGQDQASCGGEFLT